MIRPDDQSFSGIKVPFLSTYVDKADFSALTSEKAESEGERLWDELQPLMKNLEETAESTLDIIAELQAIRGYREFLAMKKNMEAFSTHNEMIVDDNKDSIHQEYGRIANMVYEFDYYIDKQDWHKGNKPYESCWYLSILNPKAASSCSNKAVLARGIRQAIRDC